ncbi:hypothetical protein VTN31DRAFT_5705 [Thermomyces dupontii]|uniref:uncharacterized protein n=1 Tax=Talaromyces thermophilus TaxID=28565 RepID=UPI00374251A5
MLNLKGLSSSIRADSPAQCGLQIHTYIRSTVQYDRPWIWTANRRLGVSSGCHRINLGLGLGFQKRESQSNLILGLSGEGRKFRLRKRRVRRKRSQPTESDAESFILNAARVNPSLRRTHVSSGTGREPVHRIPFQNNCIGQVPRVSPIPSPFTDESGTLITLDTYRYKYLGDSLFVHKFYSVLPAFVPDCLWAAGRSHVAKARRLDQSEDFPLPANSPLAKLTLLEMLPYQEDHGRIAIWMRPCSFSIPLWLQSCPCSSSTEYTYNISRISGSRCGGGLQRSNYCFGLVRIIRDFGQAR